MSYDLVGVDGGPVSWLAVVVLLAVMGLLAFCGFATVTIALAHRTLAPFGTTLVDHSVVPGLCLVFYGVFYVYYRRGVRRRR